MPRLVMTVITRPEDEAVIILCEQGRFDDALNKYLSDAAAALSNLGENYVVTGAWADVDENGDIFEMIPSSEKAD